MNTNLNKNESESKFGEFKGTKGKWYRNADSKIVSSVYSENKESLIHISGKNNEEAKANALLISKAPEMLEMLKEVNEFLSAFKYKSTIQAYSQQTKVIELIKQSTEL